MPTRESKGWKTWQVSGARFPALLQQMIRGGHWPLLERLEGNDIVEQAFASVPNIGPKLAKRIHDELGIETLAELQAAAWDGRLRRMPGFGEKRIRAVRESLAAHGQSSGNRADRGSTNRRAGGPDIGGLRRRVIGR